VVGFLFTYSRDLSIRNKENSMRKYLLVLLLTIFIIPSIAFASWWNPFSWFKKQAVQPSVVQASVPISNQTLPVKIGCHSDKGFNSITGAPCGSTTVSTATTKPQKEKQNIKPTIKQNTTTASIVNNNSNISVIPNTSPVVPHKIPQLTYQAPTSPTPPQPQTYVMPDKPIIESFCDSKGNCVHTHLLESNATSWYLSPYPTVHVGETLNFTIKVTGEEASGALAFIIPQGYDWVKEGGIKPWSTDLTYSYTFTTEDISASYPIYAYIKSSNDNYHRRSSGCNWTAYSCDDSATLEYTVLP
jgi:hypothetical protein